MRAAITTFFYLLRRGLSIKGALKVAKARYGYAKRQTINPSNPPNHRN